MSRIADAAGWAIVAILATASVRAVVTHPPARPDAVQTAATVPPAAAPAGKSPRVAPEAVAGPIPPATAGPPMAPDPPAALADDPPAAGVRVVAQPGITRPPAALAPPERVAAREIPKPPPGPPKPRVLRPVLVEDAATLRAGDIRVKLDDLEAPDVDTTCTDHAGRDWPCGARALGALRAFVRGRGVQCIVPQGARSGTFVSACAIGADDVGLWLVRRGWARPKPGTERYAAAEAAAQRDGIGLWQADVPPPERLPDLPEPPAAAATPGGPP